MPNETTLRDALAAFEVGAGCGRFGIVWFINLCMFALGLLVRPRTVCRAFVRGRHSASIYHDPPAPEVLAALTVANVRDRLRLGADVVSPRMTDYVGLAGWGLVAILVLLAPAALVVSAVWLGLRVEP